MSEPSEIALTLLEAAKLRIPPAEIGRIVDSYGVFRPRVDALYDIAPDTAEPALDFEPVLDIAG